MSSSTLRRVVTVALMSVAVEAAAQEAPAKPVDPLAAGREEFMLGEKELNLGHYEESLKHFEASYRLTSKPALLFNLGYVNRKLFERSKNIAHLEEAVERLRSFVDVTKSATDPFGRSQK